MTELCPESFQVIPDGHEDQPEVKHDGKRPCEPEIDGIEPF